MNITFFTLILNGMPFLPYLIDGLIDSAHEWFFIEGAVLPKHCTVGNAPPAWSYDPKTFLSSDGTTELLDEYARKFSKIKLVRKYDWWNGKIEMCNSFLDQITGDVLWEIDCDEFWHSEDIIKTLNLIKENPDATCVRFYSRFFVGNTSTIVEEKGLGNADWDWYRVWPWHKGCRFESHEPPRLIKTKKRCFFFPKKNNLTKMNVLDRATTQSLGIYMYHYAYVSASQIKFKEAFYTGFDNFYTQWLAMKNDLANNIYKKVEDYWGNYGDHFKGRLMPFTGKHPLQNVTIE